MYNILILCYLDRLRRVSRCINLGPTLHNSIVYRVVFKDRFGAKKAYEDCCFQYERDTISNTRRGNPNPYHPFTVDLTLLEIPVRSVYVPSLDKTALVSQITSIWGACKDIKRSSLSALAFIRRAAGLIEFAGVFPNWDNVVSSFASFCFVYTGLGFMIFLRLINYCVIPLVYNYTR